MRRGELRFRAAGALGGALVRALFLTARVERTGTEHYLVRRTAGESVVFVFWHGQLLPLLHQHRGEGAAVLVSEHADGEMVARVMERLGYTTARGSSTRGGTRGLRGLVRAAREGRDLAVTPDGPSGPARHFKPGALMAAALTGLPIVPVAVAVRPAWRLPSWDGFLVPRPFARVRIAYGPPYRVERGAGETELAAHAEILGATLDRMTAEVERALGLALAGEGAEAAA